jgi:predicted house-cleaning noncanonical NTP pyrophosphatase (MazG superfamily)
MIEDTAKIVNEAIKDKIQVKISINNRESATPLAIAQQVADRLHEKKQEGLF